jgi:dTDP-glucose 4,6-dehydratase
MREAFSHDTILVTGGAGFIGSNFVRTLHENAGCAIVIVDALTYAGNLQNIDTLLADPRVSFFHDTITNYDFLEGLFSDLNVSKVVHFAAESHVDRSILEPDTFIDTNIKGTFNLLEAARTHWQDSGSGQERFLHISTDEVFGDLESHGDQFRETTPYRPNSPYSASKAASDHLVRAWQRTYGLPVLVSNCSNNYGPWQFPEKLIPLMIMNCVQSKPLPVYGDGLQIRDWLHVEDHCEALLTILDKGNVGETYCIGGNNERTNLDIVHLICDIADERLGRESGTSRELIRHVEDRLGHDRRYAIDTAKIERELGWSPRHNFNDTLPAVVDWYLDHLEWIGDIQSGAYRAYYETQYAERIRGAR